MVYLEKVSKKTFRTVVRTKVSPEQEIYDWYRRPE